MLYFTLSIQKKLTFLQKRPEYKPLEPERPPSGPSSEAENENEKEDIEVPLANNVTPREEQNDDKTMRMYQDFEGSEDD